MCRPSGLLHAVLRIVKPGVRLAEILPDPPSFVPYKKDSRHPLDANSVHGFALSTAISRSRVHNVARPMKHRNTRRSVDLLRMEKIVRTIPASGLCRLGIVCCVAIAFLLSGCASAKSDTTNPDQCVGPVYVCNPFFGS